MHRCRNGRLFEAEDQGICRRPENRERRITMKKSIHTFILAAATTIFLLATCTACGQAAEDAAEEDEAEQSYTQISQEEAKEMMAKDDGHVVVDVRRKDEYDAGHIPGAILISNERIFDRQPGELPDLDQIILIYCRSGNRSKEAAQKLFDMGYTNVYEFGGIIDWTGEIETTLSLTETAAENGKEPIMTLTIGETEVPVTWEINASVKELEKRAAQEPLTIQMSMYGGFEQVGPIGDSIVRDDEQTTTAAGDIVLYSGNQIVIFYGSNTWDYTRLGHVDLSQEEMEAILGNGDVVVTLQMEEE